MRTADRPTPRRQTQQAQGIARALEGENSIANSAALRAPASARPGASKDDSARTRRARVPAAGQDALTGDVARPDDSPGPHRLYRPGAAARSSGSAEERR